jgi:hypothetical protein
MIIIMPDQDTLKETVTLFWNMTPCKSEDKGQDFAGIWMTKAAGFEKLCFLPTNLQYFTSWNTIILIIIVEIT